MKPIFDENGEIQNPEIYQTAKEKKEVEIIKLSFGEKLKLQGDMYIRALHRSESSHLSVMGFRIDNNDEWKMILSSDTY